MKPIQILILGMGGMGIRHLNAFSTTGMCEVACFDKNPAILSKIGLKDNVIQCFSNLLEISPKSYVGAVIATPTDTHTYYVEWCLEHSLPFLVEKPIASDLTNVPELVEACLAKSLTCGVAFPRRSSKAIQLIKSRVLNGEIGDLKIINCKFSQDFRKYRKDYKSTYYAKISTGGGVIMDALSHHINLACYFGGSIAKVHAFSERFVFEGVEGEDSAIINIRFSNGIIGTVQGNQFQKPNEDIIELIGTKGNIKYDRISEIYELKLNDDKIPKTEKIDGNWDKIIQYQAEDFLNCITQENIQPQTSLSEGLHHLRVALGARRSQCNDLVVQLEQ